MLQCPHAPFAPGDAVDDGAGLQHVDANADSDTPAADIYRIPSTPDADSILCANGYAHFHIHYSSNSADCPDRVGPDRLGYHSNGGGL